MTRPILLDTCALIWLTDSDAMSEAAVAELLEANREPGGVLVSPISAWEIGQLASRGRLSLKMDPLASARAFRYRVMTRDGPILDLARDGHLEAIAC